MIASICSNRAGVERRSWSSGDALLLQLADHVAVVGLGPLAFFGDAPRERLELAARLLIARERARHDFARIHLHAEPLQLVRIQLGRQLVRLARARQHRRLDPLAVLVELGAQRLHVLLPALEAAALEQLLNAVEVARLVVEVLLRLDDPRTDQLRVACLLLVARASQHGDRLVTLLRADVAMQARQRRFLPALRDARVEQILESRGTPTARGRRTAASVAGSTRGSASGRARRR